MCCFKVNNYPPLVLKKLMTRMLITGVLALSPPPLPVPLGLDPELELERAMELDLYLEMLPGILLLMIGLGKLNYGKGGGVVPGKPHLDPGLRALELGLNQADTLIPGKQSPLDPLLKLTLYSRPSKRNKRPGFLRFLLPKLFGPKSTGGTPPIETGKTTT